MVDHVWTLLLDPDLDPSARPDGIRVAVKDCIDVRSTVTTAGSVAVAADATPASADAECLAGFRAVGARIVGKTNLHELCFGSSGVNAAYGTPTNPIDPSRIPGGSSSGSAVAVAAGLADVALGTDTAGSIRTPAAFCGIVGLKTTFGSVPVAGTRPLAPSLDTIGVLGRTVADTVAGAALLQPGLEAANVSPATKVARVRLDGTDTTIDAAIDSALSDAGLEAVDVVLSGWQAAHEAAVTVLFGEALTVNEEILRHHRRTLGADLLDRFASAEAISPGELGAARAVRDGWRMELAEVFGEFGVVALPSAVVYPPRLGEQSVPPNPACPAVSLSGHPAVAVPVPSGGLFPASLQLVAPDHHEGRLLATAALVEAAVAR